MSVTTTTTESAERLLMRAEFESAARKQGFNLCRAYKSDDYAFPQAAGAWWAWQVALAQRTTAAGSVDTPLPEPAFKRGRSYGVLVQDAYTYDQVTAYTRAYIDAHSGKVEAAELTDDAILDKAAPFLSDGEGFARTPSVQEIIAFARIILATKEQPK